MQKNYQIITIISIILIIISSFSIKAEHENEEKLNCYGFIIPGYIECGGEYNTEFLINCKINHMINDLLREELIVYWIHENLTIPTIEITDVYQKINNFQKGSFIVPFTENNIANKKIISIINEYNQTNQVNGIIDTNIPVYLYLQQLTEVNITTLNQPKIAQYKDTFSFDSDFEYLEVANSYGFLDFDILSYDNVKEELRIENYNTVIWPGSDVVFKITKPLYVRLKDDILYDISKSIRGFVSDGGGYIGSCYGTYAASSIFEPLPLNYLEKAYDTNDTDAIGILAIADISVRNTGEFLNMCESKIISSNHPLTHGLNNRTVIDFHCGGPKIEYVGKNTDVIAVFQTDNIRFNNTPSWLSSRFGTGKIILFSTHPECIDYGEYLGGKIVTNAMYYTSMQETEELINEPMAYQDVITHIAKINEINISGNQLQILNITKKFLLENISNLEEKYDGMITYINKINDLYEKTLFPFPMKRYSIYISFRMGYKFLYEYIRYLYDTVSDIEKIQEMNSLIKDNAQYNEEIENLKDTINQNLKIINKTMSENNNLYIKYLDQIDKYNTTNFLKNIRLFFLDEIGRGYFISINSLIENIKQIKFETLKFTRSNWYEYLSEIN